MTLFVQFWLHPNWSFFLQVEELSKTSKQKSGWGSGWKKVTKSFHLKENHDSTPKFYTELHNIDTPHASRAWPIDIPVQLEISHPVALRSTKSEIVRPPKTPGESNLPPRQESLPNLKPPKAESKPNQEAVVDTLSVPVKDEPVVETELSIKGSSNVSADTLEEEMPTSTPARSKAPETSLDKPKDRRKDDSNVVVTNLPRRRSQARSTSPVGSPRHHYDSDSASVTSASSYTSTSTSTSVSSYSSHGHNRASGSRHRRRGEGHLRDKSPTRSGGHRPSSVQKSSDHSASLHSRKHRQKEGSEHHSHQSHHSGHQHSLDSYPRPSTSKNHHHRSQHSSHHSQRRKDSHTRDVSSKPSSSQRRRRPKPHHKEVYSDSDSSTDSGTRRRHR